ncbi:hypothetical protein AB0912_02360 [Streptomyces sp. NPDC007084]|uniref:hypothetical protein n=1 Tax=Streptomyces sp. NPDC007084 TaxID=3154313 RepID=UPI003456C0F6
MPALRTGSRVLITSALIGSISLSATPAMADNEIGGGTRNPPPNGQAHGDTDGEGNLSATAGVVVFDRSKNGSGNSTGGVTSSSGDWTPPACYYAPKYTPDQLQKYLEPIWNAESTSPEWDATQRDKYVNGGEAKDFNKDKAGKGYWWDSYVTPGREGDPGALKCDKSIFWVDTGDAPPADVPEAITPEILAQLAYAEIRVPSTEVDLAPAGVTKVNLPTWAWLDTAEFGPVSVTASVPLLNVSATTVAEPVSLRIEPGTGDAVTYPASGVCEIAGGRIGEAYAKGRAGETPPCGVKYLRSSGGGSFSLRATVTWRIHWTGTGVAQAQDLPDGTFGADQDVVVQEIQSVNR